MSILRSFNIGVSGLAATGGNMGVISDNIANTEAFGFKASRGEFQDVFATSLNGIHGGDQIGAGTRLAHIKPIMTQGDLSRTDISTDLAINGDGFFKVKAPFGDGFTRDGSMHFNREGYLVNADGYHVIGFKPDADGRITHRETAIKLDRAAINARATEKVGIRMNLDSRVPIKAFDINDPYETSNFSHSFTIYDNVGTSRLVNVFYNKTANNNWTYRVMADGADTTGGTAGELVQMANGTLVFNDKGVLQREVEGSSAFNFNKGAAQGHRIIFDWGESLEEGGDGTASATQYGIDSTVARHAQDGYTAGTLASLTFDNNGILSAIFDNGVSRNIAQIAVSKFENNEGLFKVGKNLFKESLRSGQAALGKPNEAGRGQVLSKTIELSNVDVANELVSLIKSQRNFSANAKALRTSDEMFKEVLQIKG